MKENKLSDEVKVFAEENGIVSFVDNAVLLVKDKFKKIDTITLRIQVDPETGDKCIVIDIIVEGSVDDILSQYDDYIEAWIELGEYTEREKICLTYSII